MARTEAFFDTGLRADGRDPSQLRKISCKVGAFKQADGSAYIEQGKTKILATVYGPQEIRGGKSKVLHDRALINCQFSMAVFCTSERRNRPRGDRKTMELNSMLQQTYEAAIRVELFPRSQIDIFVEVLQADGGVASAAINAATLALIDAGVPMKDYVCACSAAMVDDFPFLDLSHLEEVVVGSMVTFACLPRSKQIVLSEMSGRLHLDYLDKVMDAALKGCEDVFHIMDSIVRSQVAHMAAAMG